jgi:hypothetical protein
MTAKSRFGQDVFIKGSLETIGNLAIGADQSIIGSALIGASGSADAKAILDIQSTTKGILFPRMTTEQRDAIVTPPNGLTVYNITTSKLNIYNGTAWVEAGSGGSGQGGINYILNYNAEADTLGWNPYADVAVELLRLRLVKQRIIH